MATNICLNMLEILDNDVLEITDYKRRLNMLKEGI